MTYLMHGLGGQFMKRKNGGNEKSYARLLQSGSPMRSQTLEIQVNVLKTSLLWRFNSLCPLRMAVFFSHFAIWIERTLMPPLQAQPPDACSVDCNSIQLHPPLEPALTLW